MEKFDESIFKIQEISEYLEQTEEEKEALFGYKGSKKHAEINELLGEYIIETPVITNSESKDIGERHYYGMTPEIRRECIQKYLDDSVHIYSAMYKNSLERFSTYGKYGGYKVGRGSSTSLLKSQNHGFISTSTRDTSGYSRPYQESYSWASSNHLHSNQRYFSKIEVDSDVPCIGIDEGGNSNERELLVSPFVITEKDEFGGRFSNGYVTINGKGVYEEYVNIKARPLNRLSKEEQSKLRQEILEQVDDIDKMVIEYYSQTKKYEGLIEKVNKKRTDLVKGSVEYQQEINKARKSGNYDRERTERQGLREYREYLEKQIEELEKKIEQTSLAMNNNKEQILAWRHKFKQLAEAMCADKELEINQAINDITLKQKREKEERIARENAEREASASRAQEFSSIVTSNLSRVTESEEFKNASLLQSLFDRTGLRFDSSIRDVMNALNAIQEEARINSMTKEAREAFDSNNGRGESLKDQIANLNNRLKSGLSIVTNNADNEFKSAVFKEVLKIRIDQEITALNAQVARVQNQKIGMFGKKRKEEEKRTNMDYLNRQLNRLKSFLYYVEKNGLNSGMSYSARQIMAEIQIGMDSVVDGSQKVILGNLKKALESVYRIPMQGTNSVESIYNDRKEEQGGFKRAETFVDRYEGLSSISPSQRPVAPIITHLRSISSGLRDMKYNNRSYEYNFYHAVDKE